MPDETLERADEDADVPTLAVQGLNEATRRARLAGDIVVVRDGNLLRIHPNGKVEVLQSVPGRVKVAVRTQRIRK